MNMRKLLNFFYIPAEEFWEQDKSPFFAGILCLLTGVLGYHRLYMRHDRKFFLILLVTGGFVYLAFNKDWYYLFFWFLFFVLQSLIYFVMSMTNAKDRAGEALASEETGWQSATIEEDEEDWDYGFEDYIDVVESPYYPDQGDQEADYDRPHNPSQAPDRTYVRDDRRTHEPMTSQEADRDQREATSRPESAQPADRQGLYQATTPIDEAGVLSGETEPAFDPGLASQPAGPAHEAGPSQHESSQPTGPVHEADASQHESSQATGEYRDPLLRHKVDKELKLYPTHEAALKAIDEPVTPLWNKETTRIEILTHFKEMINIIGRQLAKQPDLQQDSAYAYLMDFYLDNKVTGPMKLILQTLARMSENMLLKQYMNLKELSGLQDEAIIQSLLPSDLSEEVLTYYRTHE